MQQALHKTEGVLITILDFEKIVSEIALRNFQYKLKKLKKWEKEEKIKKPIIMAEDSVLLAKLIRDSLNKAGYQNVLKFDNGEEDGSI